MDFPDCSLFVLSHENERVKSLNPEHSCNRPGPLSPTTAVKMMINAADGEDGPRAFEALGGIAAAHSAELKAGLAAFNVSTKS